MTANARIVLNILATYGRSLYAMALGLFTARWALQALGEVDFGLMGLVGGLAGFIAFLNHVMAAAAARFYAVNVGKQDAAADKKAALEETREWFTTAVIVHTVLPTLLMLAGYPAGVWAVRHFLDIPPERLADCVWVFRFACAGTFASMVGVPVQAMYTAKQRIAELTVYSFAATTLNALVLRHMATHPGVWLATYACWTCLLAAAPQALIAARGLWLFPECRLGRPTGGAAGRVAELARYGGWLVFGMLGGLLRGQGIQILLNKYFGPRANAAMKVANDVNAYTQTLSAAMVGAFQPAIAAAYGAGDWGRMRSLAYRACKFSTLFALAFALPLGLELREVLRIWLETPPPHVHGLCLCMIAATVVDQSSVGHMMAVNARGKIAAYQAFLGGSLLLALPLAWLLLAAGRGVCAVGLALLGTTVLCAWGRVGFARGLVGMSAWHWLRRILAPAAGVAAACLGAGALPRLWMGPSPARVAATTALCESLFLGLAWGVLLDGEERACVRKTTRDTWRRWAGPVGRGADGKGEKGTDE
jgi:O-antigen/teichoic acid export membrane protein